MVNSKALIKKVLIRARDSVRQRRLELGESGWGRPVPQPIRLPGLAAGRSYKVAIIGAGSQGYAQCQGLAGLKGVEIVGLADIDQSKLRKATEVYGIPTQSCFTDAEQMLKEVTPLDLISVATTAPSHVKLGRLALNFGVRRILLEKPIDNSLCEAVAFSDECHKAGVALAVNYSRRWMLDYKAIKRCIAKNYIGDPRSISIVIGKGELAMHGSHYFDLCCYLLDSEPAWVISHLEPITEVNARGKNFEDPSGFCLFVFKNGARAYIDFSSDLYAKDPFVTIKGTLGRITVDELRAVWTLQSRSQRLWQIPFSENLKASTLFSRVAGDMLSNQTPSPRNINGIAALTMIIGAHLSHKRGNCPVTFPLSHEDSSLNVKFP